MLVLAHTDGFGINFHQFCQGILDSSCNGSGTSLSYIKIVELFRSQFAGGIYGSSCLIDNHILYRIINLFEQLYNDLLGLSGGSSISNRKQRNMVFFYQLF